MLLCKTGIVAMQYNSCLSCLAYRIQDTSPALKGNEMTTTSYDLRQPSFLARLFGSLFAAIGSFFHEVVEVTARNGNVEPFGL